MSASSTTSSSTQTAATKGWRVIGLHRSQRNTITTTEDRFRTRIGAWLAARRLTRQSDNYRFEARRVR